jgi:large subunit ribosomal protein L31
MKPNIHPETRAIVFKDVSAGESFLINSTIQTKEKVMWTDGVEYPLVTIDVSSASHPAFNGSKIVEKQSSRREAFEKKYAKPMAKKSSKSGMEY